MERSSCGCRLEWVTLPIIIQVFYCHVWFPIHFLALVPFPPSTWFVRVDCPGHTRRSCPLASTHVLIVGYKMLSGRACVVASRGFGKKDSSSRNVQAQPKSARPLSRKLYVRPSGDEAWTWLGHVDLPNGGDPRLAVQARLESLERSARKVFPQLALASGAQPLQLGLGATVSDEGEADPQDGLEDVVAVAALPSDVKVSKTSKANFTFADGEEGGAKYGTDGRGRKRWNSPKLSGLEGGARMKK